ncbi:MAG: hypothetical protein H7Y89_16495 [Steroidobacteraceae bacterium]|nr:hypothetical protein [Steroidobacteraceae bacterium]
MHASLARRLTWAAAVSWIAAWFLPVIDDISGWQAFRYAVSSIWAYQGHQSSEVEDAVPHVLSALSNVAFIILAAHVELGRVTRPGTFLRIAIACLMLNLYWVVQLFRDGSADDLQIGYYVWLAAFALLVVSGVSIHRTSRTPTAGTPA